MKFKLSQESVEEAGLEASEDGLYELPQTRNFLFGPEPEADLNPTLRDGVGHLYLNGEIDALFGVGPGTMAKALAEFPADAPVVLHINSPGGTVNDAIAMVAQLNDREGSYEAVVEGMAGSAATFFLMSANVRKATKLSTVMIHNSSAAFRGDSDAHERVAKLLKATDIEVASFYADRSKLSKDKLLEMMSAGTSTNMGTTMTAQQALSNGFVDELVELKSKVKEPVAASNRDDNYRLQLQALSLKMA